MNIDISTAVKNRNFGRAIRKALPAVDWIKNQFEEIEFTDPIHDTLLIGITDDRDSTFFEEIPNRDGYFQVLFGVGEYREEMKEQGYLESVLVNKIILATKLCPFSKSDKILLKKHYTNWNKGKNA